ncbi:MAG: Glyoxalase/bleomycin resistance protein/dioxygenase superfamily protein [Actinomycetia bacterium]|nr:Glyoxalase/bleomycin resistance protein/dioxygenase superfamily protein [Actinomycetes bacterium]
MSDAAPGVVGFTFVVLTAQPEETVRFWRDVLGGVVESTSSSDLGEMTILQVGPGRVEILGVPNDRAPAPARSVQVALSVEDVSAWHARLVEHGARVTYGPSTLESGGASLGTADPNGVLISFFTPAPEP